MSSPKIIRITREDLEAVKAASRLFDRPVSTAATTRFLESPTHHLLIAYSTEAPVGFITGVEMTHPDKGTEMFIYEVGVEESSRGIGIGAALVSALEDLARKSGCYGMWVLTDRDNDAALATYRKVGANREKDQVMLSWEFSD